VSVAGLVDARRPAAPWVRWRGRALLTLAAAAAAAAVVLDRSLAGDLHTPASGPRLAAALAAFLCGSAVVLGGWDRSRRDDLRRVPMRWLAAAGGILWFGMALGYLLTAGAAGEFDPRVEVIPLLVGLPVAAYPLVAICWPSAMSRTDIRVAVADSVVAVLSLGIIWWMLVVPAWVYPPGRDAWEHLDQWVMFVALSITVVLGVVSRRIGSLPMVQLGLLLGGLAMHLGSDLLGQVTKNGDALSRVTYSIAGYLVAASLVVAFTQRPAVEVEGRRAQQIREWLSAGLPIGLALVAGGTLLAAVGGILVPRDVNGARYDEPAVIELAAALLWIMLLVAILASRLSAAYELRRAQAGAAGILLAERTREGWFRALIGDSTEMIFVLDSGGVILYASPKVEREIALHERPQPFQAAHRHAFVEVLAQRPDVDMALILAAVSADPSRSGPYELSLRGHDGTLEVEAVVRTLADIEFQGFVVTARDVTDARRLQRQLDSSALVDSLTRLRSRESFLSEVQRHLDETAQQQVAIVMLDLDRFGALNESLGHDAGDEILVAIADSFSLLPEEIVAAARIASDTFAWLVVAADADQAVGESVEHARVDLRGLILRDGREVELSFRCGFVVADAERVHPADWYLEAADLALARSRASRNALLVEYHEEMRAETERRIAAERQLRWALAEDRFEVHYQPIVDLADGHVHGAEALVRLRATDGRLVPPVDFIPVAEEIGLIGAIGLVVLERACRETVDVSRTLGRPLHISVNVSPDQLTVELVGEVRRCLAGSGLPASQLTLEITEETLADRSPRTQSVLHDLRALGLTVSLDDFGTGYSSMSYLATLPVDGLKIDRSFVSGMGSQSDSITLSRLVVQLAASLDLTTVAEGVETVEQADLLRGMGCRYGQGYLWSRPVPFADYVELLAGPTVQATTPV
jgi:diguanylate cyclase (GGDEF)-like protein